MTVNRRRWLRRGAGLLALLTVAWFGRGWWLEPLLARQVAARLGRALGGPVTVARVGGPLLSGVTISGVAGPALSATSLSALSLTSVEARWSPLFWLGFAPQQVRRLSAHEVTLAIDVVRPRDKPATTTWPPFLATLPESLPELDLDGSVQVRTAAGPLRLDGCRIQGQGDRFILEVATAQVPGWPEPLSARCVAQRSAGQLAITEPVSVGPLIVTSAVFSADAQAQGLALIASGADGQWLLDVAPGHWRAQAIDIAACALPETVLAWCPSDWRPSAGRLDATMSERGILTVAWRELTIRGFACSGSATIELQPTRTLTELTLHSEDLDLHAHDVVFGPGGVPIAGQAELHCRDAGRWLARIGIAGVPAGLDVTATLHASSGDWNLTALHIAGTGIAITGTASVSLLDGIAADLHLAADLEPLSTIWPALAECHGQLTGSVAVRGELATMLHPRQLTASLRIDSDRLSRGTVAIEQIHATATLAEHDAGWRVTLREITATWQRLAFAHHDTATVDWTPEGWQLAAPTGTVSGAAWTLAAHSHHGQLAATLALHALPLTTLLPFTSGQLDGELTIAGDPARPDGHLTLTAHGPEATQIALALRQDASGLHLETAEGNWPGWVTLHGTGTLPAIIGSAGWQRGDGDATMDFTLFGPDPVALSHGWLTSGRISATATISARTHGPEVDVVLDAADLVPRVPKPDLSQISPPLPPSAAVRAYLHVGPDGVTARCASIIDAQPALYGFAQVAYDGSLDGALILDQLDMTPFAALHNAVLRLGGQLDGRLTLTGTLREPRWSGRLECRDGECKLLGDVPTIDHINGTLTVDGPELRLEALQAELAGAPLRLHGVLRPNADPPSIDLHLDAENALLVRGRDLRLRANLVDLRLSGPLAAPTLAGDITITSALWSRRYELLGNRDTRGAGADDGRLELFSLEGPAAAVALDLRLRTSTDRHDEGLRLANNLLRAKCSADLRLRGTLGTPEPSGTITTRDAQVRLPFAVLTIERAELRFAANDPFRPQVEAVGTAQVRQWLITINASGPLDDVAVEAAATGLDNDDAVLLLTTGATRSELEDPDGQRALLSRVGTYLGSELLRVARGESDPDAKDTILDRWTVEFGREITASGRDTIDSEVRLNRYEKPTGLYLTGGRDRYDDYNLGVTLRFRYGARSRR